MASVDNGNTVTLESNPSSPGNGVYGNNSINDSLSYTGGNIFLYGTGIDDTEITMYFESNSLTSANGQYASNVINNSTQITNSNTFRYSFNETEVANTILFPASSYDSLVEPAIHFYKLRGYYTAGLMFETWVSSTVSNPPPSGHTLVGITIVDEWTV